MKKYPRTEKYDNNWVSENWMGPNPLWLLEELCEHIELKPGYEGSLTWVAEKALLQYFWRKNLA